MNTVASLGLLSFFQFLRNTLGVFTRPYETYRRLSVSYVTGGSTLYIFLLVVFYFFWSNLLRFSERSPFIITYNVSLMLLGAIVGFSLVVWVLLTYAGVIKRDISLIKIFIMWSYSLIPTLVWFLATSLLYIVFPPPRSFTFPGKIVSIVYIAFSISLLSWKIILYYLTLRFGLRIGAKHITLVSLILFPVLALFAWGMYTLGIFKIPFI